MERPFFSAFAARVIDLSILVETYPKPGTWLAHARQMRVGSRMGEAARDQAARNRHDLWLERACARLGATFGAAGKRRDVPS
jgi:hypothetical protein